MKLAIQSAAAALIPPLTLLLVSCSPAAEQKPGELVTNPGFETTEMGIPAGWTLAHFVSTLSPVSMTGKNSLKFQVDDIGAQPLAAQNIHGFKLNQLHRLEYNVRTDRPGVEYRIYTEFWDSKLGWVAASNGEWLQGIGNWQDVAAVFKTPPQSDRLLIVLQVRGPGTAWFDNVSVRAIPAITGQATPLISPPVAVPTVHAPEGVEPGVKITADRRFRVNGKPFFPIKIWGWWPQSEAMMKSAHDFGYNVVGAPAFKNTGPGAARLWLDAAQRNGLYAMAQMGYLMPGDGTAESVLATVNAETEKVLPVLRNHPALFGYHLVDEPSLGGYDVATTNKGAQWLKAQDPYHPIHINHAPANTIDELKAYNHYIDIAGSDIYPVRWDGVGYHSTLPNKTLSIVGDETRKNLAAVDNKKPVMQALQGFIWQGVDEPGERRFPTRHESRFMAWDSILAGATAISWFQNEQYPYLHPGLKPIVREFASLQDVLAGGTAVTTKGVFASPIQTMAYRWKGKTVLIASNPSQKTVKLAANWKPTFAKFKPDLRVLWENRKSEATETFAPYDVHIYTDAAKDSEILRPGFPVDPINAPAK